MGKIFTFCKEQGVIYIATLIMLIILIGVSISNWKDITNNPILELTLSYLLMFSALTLNIIKNEKRLKKILTCKENMVILIFFAISCFYIYVSSDFTNKNPGCIILETLSIIFFNLSIFFMGNLFNLIDTKD